MLAPSGGDVKLCYGDNECVAVGCALDHSTFRHSEMHTCMTKPSSRFIHRVATDNLHSKFAARTASCCCNVMAGLSSSTFAVGSFSVAFW